MQFHKHICLLWSKAWVGFISNILWGNWVLFFALEFHFFLHILKSVWVWVEVGEPPSKVLKLRAGEETVTACIRSHACTGKHHFYTPRKVCICCVQMWAGRAVFGWGEPAAENLLEALCPLSSNSCLPPHLSQCYSFFPLDFAFFQKPSGDFC